MGLNYANVAKTKDQDIGLKFNVGGAGDIDPNFTKIYTNFKSLS